MWTDSFRILFSFDLLSCIRKKRFLTVLRFVSQLDLDFMPRENESPPMLPREDW